jgi:hypothetical protein
LIRHVTPARALRSARLKTPCHRFRGIINWSYSLPAASPRIMA